MHKVYKVDFANWKKTTKQYHPGLPMFYFQETTGRKSKKIIFFIYWRFLIRARAKTYIFVLQWSEQPMVCHVLKLDLNTLTCRKSSSEEISEAPLPCRNVLFWWLRWSPAHMWRRPGEKTLVKPHSKVETSCSANFGEVQLTCGNVLFWGLKWNLTHMLEHFVLKTQVKPQSYVESLSLKF